MKRPPQIVGNIGLYWVCFKLSERGWNVMPTSRNARGIDIICFSMDGLQMLTVQVKSLSKRPPVPLGKDLDRIMGNFWIIVNSLDTGNPQAYILFPDEVRDKATRSEKRTDVGTEVQFWLAPKDYAVDEFKERWDRIQEEAAERQYLQERWSKQR